MLFYDKRSEAIRILEKMIREAFAADKEISVPGLIYEVQTKTGFGERFVISHLRLMDAAGKAKYYEEDRVVALPLIKNDVRKSRTEIVEGAKGENPEAPNDES